MVGRPNNPHQKNYGRRKLTLVSTYVRPTESARVEGWIAGIGRDAVIATNCIYAKKRRTQGRFPDRSNQADAIEWRNAYRSEQQLADRQRHGHPTSQAI
jgi:hypothetical protein